jgi:hypothetical protein
MFLALNNTPRFKHSKLVYLQAAESWSCTLAPNWAIYPAGGKSHNMARECAERTEFEIEKGEYFLHISSNRQLR